MNKLIVVLCIAMLSTGCMDKTNKLQERITELEKQLDDCQNGSDKLLAQINAGFENKEYKKVIALYDSLKIKHPNSPEIERANEYFAAASDSLERENIRLAERKAEEQARLEKEKAEKLASLKKLKKKLDDVSGITWYKQPYFTHFVNSNRVSLDLGSKQGTTWINLRMSYEGDDWIFFEKAYLSYDGNTKEITFDKYKEKDTDHDGGRVFEWIDVVDIDQSTITFLGRMAKSSNAKVRFSGKYTKTRNLSTNERKGITDILNGYNALLANKTK